VYPTPVIGMLGLIEDVKHITTSHFKNEGEVIAVIGKKPKGYDGLGGSEYLKIVHNKIAGDAPDIDPEYEKKLHSALLQMIRYGLINSAHDISEGGIAAALAECCVMNRKKAIGCDVELSFHGRKDFGLFNEAQSRIIISLDNKNEKKCKEICSANNIEFSDIGITGGESLKINNVIHTELDIIKQYYFNAIKRIMDEG
jgi:phosphoribosylformylglycinamidine (FGAM) synthase-like enzyme